MTAKPVVYMKFCLSKIQTAHMLSSGLALHLCPNHPNPHLLMHTYVYEQFPNTKSPEKFPGKQYFLRVIPILKHDSDIASDMPSGSISGIYSNIPPGTLSGNYSDLLSDIFSSIHAGILSDICSDILSDILSGILSGNILFRILSEILSGVCLRSGSSH